MLGENIRAIRTSRGLSQEQLAARLHVVRQTVSKWEKGLSAPDAEMLTALSEALGAPVGVLLGEAAPQRDDLAALSEQLEALRQQQLRRREALLRAVHVGAIALGALLAAALIALFIAGSPYLQWDYGNPETAVAGVMLHGAEWLFVRLAPLLLAAAIAAAVLTRPRRNQKSGADRSA